MGMIEVTGSKSFVKMEGSMGMFHQVKVGEKVISPIDWETAHLVIREVRFRQGE